MATFDVRPLLTYGHDGRERDDADSLVRVEVLASSSSSLLSLQVLEGP